MSLEGPSMWSRLLSCFSSEDSPKTDPVLEKIQQLQPEGLRILGCVKQEDWQLVNVDGLDSCLGDWIRIDSLDSSSSSDNSLAVKGPIAAVAADTCVGIIRELDLYFLEKRNRVSSKLHLSSLEDARMVFARSLRRFVASMRHSTVDKVSLDKWCDLLQQILKTRVFSRSNWLFTSNFERSLGACSALLERFRGMYEMTLTPFGSSQIACTLTFEEVRGAVEERIRAMDWKSRPVAALPCQGRLMKLERKLAGAQSIFPALAAVVWAQRRVMNLVQAMAYLDLASQIAKDAADYHAGYIDEITLVEQIVGASGAIAAYSIAWQWSSSFRLAAGPFRLSASYLSQSFALDLCAEILEEYSSKGLINLNDHLLRLFGEHVQGGRSARGLQCAYASLGLNPDGYLEYSPQQIEMQIDWMLSQGGNPLKLWGAYEYIRMHQHSGLRDPWETSNDELETLIPASEPSDRSGALKILGLDPGDDHSAATIRRQFFQLCLLHHPDKATGDHASYLRLREAYDCLRSS